MALKRILFLLVFFSVLSGEWIGIAQASFFNWGSCLRWRITGICKIVCFKKFCIVYVWVHHWRPDEVSETVNVPGDSIWGKSFSGVVASIFGATSGSVPSQAVGAFGGTGGGGVRSAPGAVMDEKFFESHVFSVPWSVMVAEQPFLAKWGCQGGGSGLIYASEPDPLWRNDLRDPDQDAQASMVGIWGPLYPRQGRAFHGSDVVASALLSYRAMHLGAGVGSKEVQLGYPTQTGCMQPGADPQAWDYNKGKAGSGGKYLWVYWKPVKCCLKLN